MSTSLVNLVSTLAPPAILGVSRLLLLVLSLSGVVAVQAASPEIIIQGGIKSLQDNIRHFLPLADQGCDTPPWRLRALVRDSQTQVARAAEALGYYQLTYASEIENLENCWRLTLRLEPGEPVRVAELRLVINGEGSGDPVFQAIHKNPGIKLGDRLNHGRYETLKGRFGSLATARGYFDGRFELSQVAVNLAENTARIELVYNTGPRYRLGEISIHQEILDDAFVRRYLNIAPGDEFDADKLLQLKALYGASKYFALASITPDLQALGDGEVPVNIQLDARKRYSYSIGAGVDTDTGPRLRLGYEDRYFTSTGHFLEANLQLSEVRSNLEAAYTIPWQRPAHQYLRFSSGYQHESFSDSRSDLYRVGASYTSMQDNQWLFIYGLNLEREFSRVAGEAERRTDLLIPSLQVSRSRTDGNPYPLKGWRLQGRLSGSPETLGSDFSFLQFYGQAKFIQSVGKGRLLLRTEVGSTRVSEFSQLPLSVRYFAGGDTSVRGYSYKSIGTEDAEGKVIGGRHLLTASVEYDYRVRPQWAIAAFFDQGDAAENFDFDFKRSVGIGVRWISPIGPVRIDLACALDGVRCSTGSTEGWGLHLSMGPDL